MSITVECITRPEGSKPRALRRSGMIPANLYGHKGAESISLVLNAKSVDLILKQAIINKTELELKITDISWNVTAIIREVQTHPCKEQPYHLSFFAYKKC